MREFLPLSTPILMVAASYPLSDDSVPSYVADLSKHIESRTAEGEGLGGSKKEVAGLTWSKEVTVLSLEELLPMSFGPEQLAEGTDKA
jgi:cytidine deaminase